ncbi:N-acetylmuramate alpha-1-phosphate uridylyltransferase MurU [Aliiglaciecola lipolytica]|uniref:N-acetylmuramate alpha-1-phosphate uridylyltransferase MurU n=2 Tax=Aliiglaciecola TaxID=1406885 RepID=UPI00339D8820
MKVAMILAAGRGERMRPLTDTTPKPLLTVKGKALIELHLEKLALAGFQHVVINHAWLGEQIVAFLGNGERYNLQIHYSAETSALETAGGIINALPLLKSCLQQQRYFTVINADIYSDFEFSCLPNELDGSKGHLVLVNNPPHNLKGDFNVIDHKVVRQPQNQFTFSGIAVYDVGLFANLDGRKSPLAPLLFDLAEKGQLTGQHHTGIWFDIGTPQRLEQINKMEG